MIDCAHYLESLKKNQISFYTGVPDSLLKNFCFYLQDHMPAQQHMIAANEGNAIALAAGHYLATGFPALVYLQNSGLGNTINPLISLCDTQVYSIPLLLMIGWRGEPGVSDEPQHIRQGEITETLLKTLGIEYAILPQETAQAIAITTDLLNSARQQKKPVALLVKKNSFTEYKISKPHSDFSLSREQAIIEVINLFNKDELIVATTGKAARELYELRESRQESHQRDFLNVGAMGHASMIALKLACEFPARRVICLDGDGAMLMHLGALVTIAKIKPANLIHIVLNNGMHESVGGQPTGALQINIVDLATAVGYSYAQSISTADELQQCLLQLSKQSQLSLLEIKLNAVSSGDLGRPKLTLAEMKDLFMQCQQ